MTKDPIVRLSKAEQALAEASDILDILELRSKAKAIEVIAAAEQLGELAQKAKVFQLKAERKAGLWLQENIKPGRPSQDGKVTLNDLQISYNDSSRWQLMAKIPEDKFYAWLDERLAKGHEITAGGLRAYARNLLGEKVTAPNTPGYIMLNPPGCALRGFKVKCDGPIQGGHIIHKDKARGNPEARAILAACPDEIMAPQCMAHNVGRIANSREAMRIQLLQKVYQYGWSHMKEWFEMFLSTYKVRPVELELERLLEP